MNKIYKVIWNATLGTWVAVSELAKGKTKSSKVTSIVGAATITLMVTFSPQAFATYIAGGGGDNSTATTGIAIGNGNPGSATVGANGAEGIAIGATTRANGSQSTVIGNDITGNGDQSVIIGSNFNSNMTVSTGKGGVAIGSGLGTSAAPYKSPMANGTGSVALGSSGDGTTNTYNGALASGEHALALMAGSQASAKNSIAMGVGAHATNTNTIAIGAGADTGVVGSESLNNIAIGANAKNGTTNSFNPAGTGSQIALGTNATTTTFAQIAIGVGANAGPQNYGIAIGGGATVTSNSGVAMGRNSQAASYAVGIGPNAQATGISSTALGNGAVASVDNSVALGNTSTTTAATATASGVVNGKSYAYKGVTPFGVVSVGSAGNERQIQNVAAGQVNVNSTDAINGSQLFQTDTELAKIATDTATALGGGAKAGTAAGGITAPSYTINLSST